MNFDLCERNKLALMIARQMLVPKGKFVYGVLGDNYSESYSFLQQIKTMLMECPGWIFDGSPMIVRRDFIKANNTNIYALSKTFPDGVRGHRFDTLVIIGNTEIPDVMIPTLLPNAKLYAIPY